MFIRMLGPQETTALEGYLAPHRPSCMFICSNLNIAGITYSGNPYEGEYYGAFERVPGDGERLSGIIVHYWNGNIMVHALSDNVRARLIDHLQRHITRPILGVLGPSAQAAHVIKAMDLEGGPFKINRDEGLYALPLDAFQKSEIPSHMDVCYAHEIQESILLEWLKNYRVEALGAKSDEDLEVQVRADIAQFRSSKDRWVLHKDNIPVALVGINARLTDMVQVGPVWTPPEYRNQGFARLLLAQLLFHEASLGVRQAILFTHHPAAIRVYDALGFRKIGDYRLALFEKPMGVNG